MLSVESPFVPDVPSTSYLSHEREKLEGTDELGTSGTPSSVTGPDRDGGVAHRMHLARPSRVVASRLGLNPNHHARVWCECQSDQKYDVGYFSERPRSAVEADPRRLGGWDYLGVVDLREPFSALALYREHVRRSSNA